MFQTEINQLQKRIENLRLAEASIAMATGSIKHAISRVRSLDESKVSELRSLILEIFDDASPTSINNDAEFLEATTFDHTDNQAGKSASEVATNSSGATGDDTDDDDRPGAEINTDWDARTDYLVGDTVRILVDKYGKENRLGKVVEVGSDHLGICIESSPTPDPRAGKRDTTVTTLALGFKDVWLYERVKSQDDQETIQSDPIGMDVFVSSENDPVFEGDKPDNQITNDAGKIIASVNENGDIQPVAKTQSTELVKVSDAVHYLKFTGDNGQLLATYVGFKSRATARKWGMWAEELGKLTGKEITSDYRETKRLNKKAWKYELKLTGMTLEQIQKLATENLSQFPGEVVKPQTAQIKPLHERVLVGGMVEIATNRHNLNLKGRLGKIVSFDRTEAVLSLLVDGKEKLFTFDWKELKQFEDLGELVEVGNKLEMFSEVA